MAKLYPRLKYRLGTLRRSRNFPVSLHIEPTNACNLHCGMCPQGDSSYPSGFMEFEVFRSLVDECANYPQCYYFILHKDGESFLHPEFLEFISYLRFRIPSSYIYIATNGHFLEPKINAKLIEYGVDSLSVSLRAATPETYESIHHNSNYQNVVNGIKALILYKERKGAARPEISLQIIDCHQTRNEIELFKRQWKEYPVKTYVKEFINWGGARSKGSMKERLPDRFPCVYLWTRPAVNWDGKVSICCLDWDRKSIIGKLPEQSLYEIWQGEAMTRYRNSHLENNYEQSKLCKHCNRWVYLINPFFLNPMNSIYF